MAYTRTEPKTDLWYENQFKAVCSCGWETGFMHLDAAEMNAHGHIAQTGPNH